MILQKSSFYIQKLLTNSKENDLTLKALVTIITSYSGAIR